MKTPITIAVLALHVVVIGAILIQPGCNSNKTPAEEVNPELTKTVEVTPAEAPKLPEGSAGLRDVPTRPIEEAIVNPPTEVVSVVNEVVEESAVEMKSYTVVKGDSVAKISHKFGVTQESIFKANGLSKKSVLKLGQKLKIPAKAGVMMPAVVEETVVSETVVVEKSPIESSEMVSYVVVKGDTLGKIGKKHGVSVDSIMKVNKLKSTNIRLGQKLTIPVKGGVKVAKASSKSGGVNTVVASGESVKYKVKSGDMLESIARKHGVSVDSIMRANGIKDPRKLRAGQELVISGGKVKAEEKVSEEKPIQSMAVPVQKDVETINVDSIKPLESVPAEGNGVKMEQSTEVIEL